jgi:hypothetical protein
MSETETVIVDPLTVMSLTLPAVTRGEKVKAGS